MTRSFFSTVGLVGALLVGACSDDSSPTKDAGSPDRGAADGTLADGAGDRGLADGLAGKTFAAPLKWATPTTDYIKAGEAKFGAGKIYQHIWDLAVFQKRLYLGYGDATNNMGRVVKIQLRYFASPTSTTHTAEFDTDEESINTFRLVGDDLVIPGVDATQDAWLGNVYVKRGSAAWFKSRTLDGGVHVHDVAAFGGKLYAVGSGAKQAEWGKEIFSHLWQSTDSGKTFSVLDRKSNKGIGDIRSVYLLPLKKTMYMFGYWYQSSSKLLPNNSTFDGTKRADLPTTHELAYVWADRTQVVSDDLGVVAGMKIVVVPTLNYALWKVDGAGKVTQLTHFTGRRVVDIYRIPETGQCLVLSHDESEYSKVRKLTQWKTHVTLTSDFSTFKELLTYTTDSAPLSVASWNGALYLGNTRGEILRSTAK